MRRLLLLFLLLFSCLFRLSAQSSYPIFVTPSLTPPYSLKLNEYREFGSQKLMLSITVNDLEISNLPVKLHIKMETTGVTIETPTTISTTPIYLDGGSVSTLFGEDFTDYFNINNLTFKGYSKATYKSTGMLPEGYYQFSVEVLDYNTNRVISNTGIVSAWIAVGNPPDLLSPKTETEVGKYNGMPVTFSWLASNVASPISVGSVQYLFEMWELRVDGIEPNTVIASTAVFHEYTTYATNYSLYPSTLLMEPGMSYAWRVTASDVTGYVPFEQDGHSEVRTFTYKASCDSVDNFTGTTKGTTGIFTWDPQDNHTSFNTELQNPYTLWTQTGETYEAKASFFDLPKGSNYQMRVQAVCDGDPESVSDFTAWQSVPIAKDNSSTDTTACEDCGCDDDIPDVELTNFELRTDLQEGDTLSNKTGTTRFIIKTIEEQNGDTYKGVFLFWAEIWSLKIQCNFWDLQANTDNVIVNMDYESVYNPGFVLDVDAATDYFSNLIDTISSAFTNEITDTINIGDNDIATIYVTAGDSLVIVSVDANGDTVITILDGSTDDYENTLITDADGNQYVVSGNGSIMSKDVYEATGGKDKNVDDLNDEKEETLADTVVSFAASSKQSYGFDAYNSEKTKLVSDYPALDNGYQAPFKSIASYGTDKVTIGDVSDDIVFKDEMGIPPTRNGNELTIRGSADGTDVNLYAFQKQDSVEKVAGKLVIKSYDIQPLKVVIVPVNNASIPTASDLQKVLNQVYAQATTQWTVSTAANLPVTFTDGNMVHGGSSSISTYNDDQKLVAEAYETANGDMDDDTYYLFFVDGVQFKDRSIAGYMPLERQVGFIYDNPDLEIVAHELGHGAFNLYHTFSTENLIATEGTTKNLMDYNGGTELWNYQWDLIHDPQTMLFAWAQEEEEGAMVTSDDVYVKSIFNEILCGKKNNLSEIDVTGYKKLEQQNPGVFWASDLPNAGYIGHFETTLKYASSQSKNILAINVIKQTDNQVTIGDDVNCKLQVSIRRNLNPSATDAEKLSAYLKANQEETNNHIESLMLKMDGIADIGLLIQNIPDCWFSEISNNRRIEYLKKLSSKADDNINNIIKLVNTVSKENTASFFTKLGETSLFYDFKDRGNISFDNYTAFIRAATLLYYQQDGLKDKLINLPYNRVFVNQAREGSIGASISNSFSPNQSTVTITGNVVLVYREPGTESPYAAYNQTPNRTTSFQAYSYPVGYCDLIGLELDSDFGHLKASVHNDVVPLPAFYFDWINTNLQRESTLQSVDIAVTLVSLTVGIGELQAISKIGRFVFAVKLVGVVKSSVDLVLLNQRINNFIETGSSTGASFISNWRKFSILYDLATFDLRNINKDRNFFNDLGLTWTASKAALANEIDPQLFKEINAVLLEVEQELNK